jgi:hypothetical protein
MQVIVGFHRTRGFKLSAMRLFLLDADATVSIELNDPSVAGM